MLSSVKVSWRCEGNPSIIDSNRWQALALDFFIDQSGIPFPLGVPPFLSPEWGTVTPFALSSDDLTIYEEGGNEYWLYHDPGAPPKIGGLGDAEYRKRLGKGARTAIEHWDNARMIDGFVAAAACGDRWIHYCRRGIRPSGSWRERGREDQT